MYIVAKKKSEVRYYCQIKIVTLNHKKVTRDKDIIY